MKPYEIVLEGNILIVVHSRILPHYTYHFNFENNRYKAIMHWGTKVSFFQEETQVGYYLKDYLLNYKVGMKLVLNRNLNLDFFTILALNIHSNFTAENRDGGVPSFLITFQEKKFDGTWSPT